MGDREWEKKGPVSTKWQVIPVSAVLVIWWQQLLESLALNATLKNDIIMSSQDSSILSGHSTTRKHSHKTSSFPQSQCLPLLVQL